MKFKRVALFVLVSLLILGFGAVARMSNTGQDVITELEYVFLFWSVDVERRAEEVGPTMGRGRVVAYSELFMGKILAFVSFLAWCFSVLFLGWFTIAILWFFALFLKTSEVDDDDSQD